jgi:putative DNA primase/helicase
MAWFDAILADAPLQQSHRGGHFLVRLSDVAELKNSTKVRVADGIEVDIRAHGAQIVAQPSVHASGTPYAWKRPLVPWRDLPELPPILRDVLEVAVIARESRSAAGHPGDEIPEGRRNTTLASIAGSLRRRGLSGDEIETLVLKANARSCKPPLQENEVRGIARSMERYPRGPGQGARARSTEAKQEREAQTDLGNARRLVREHGRDLRHCAELNVWLVWDGGRWAEDKTGEVIRRAKTTARSIYKEAAAVGSETGSRDLAQHGLKSQSERALRAMVNLAASEPEIAVTSAQLDVAPQLFNVKNGTLDLETFELRPHRREDLLTKIAPVAYHPQASCEEWNRFVERTLPDPDVRRFAQKAAGYTLLGRADRDVLFVVHGPPRTGKGSFQDAIAAVLGEDYAATAGLSDFGQRRFEEPGPRPELVRLRGARMVNVYETSDRLRLSASLVKSLAGGDKIAARGLHQRPIEFRPQFAIWIASNHRPGVPDDDEALWERIREIPFSEVVPDAERDPALRRRLRADPAIRAGILAWAVEGLQVLEVEGFAEPQGVRKATQSYRQEMDPIAEFLEECCELCPTVRDAWMTAGNLRRVYEAWCKENGRQEISAQAMGRRLRKRGCERERISLAGRKRGIWRGIRLATEDP